MSTQWLGQFLFEFLADFAGVCKDAKIELNNFKNHPIKSINMHIDGFDWLEIFWNYLVLSLAVFPYINSRQLSDSQLLIEAFTMTVTKTATLSLCKAKKPCDCS